MPEHTPAPTPSRAVYGFALHLIFKILFIIYLLWAIIPEEWLEYIGITYLPQRYWAIAVPIFVLNVFAIFAFLIYPSLGLYMTPNFDDLRTITDAKAIKSVFQENERKPVQNFECVCRYKENCEKEWFDNLDYEEFENNCVPSIRDLDINAVSENLYL